MDVSLTSMSSKIEKKGRGGGVLLKLDQLSDLVYYSAPQTIALEQTGRQHRRGNDQ